MGQHKKEKKLYRKANHDFPDNLSIIRRKAILALYEGKTKKANEYIEKYKSIQKENSQPEATIASNLARIYSEAGNLDKAEEYYREALTLEPEKPGRFNSLAYFLIDNERDIDEGMELINKALENQPDNYNYLDTKGWGLFKQGKYIEALEFLVKADSLKPIYFYDLYLHFEEAKKAVARERSE